MRRVSEKSYIVVLVVGYYVLVISHKIRVRIRAMNGVNYYQLFSLSPGASVDELRAQYRKLSLKHHPDRGGSTEQMAQLNEAYRVLSNPLLRREYDQKRAAALYVTANDDYHYTQPRPRPTYTHAQAAAASQAQSHFWRWFIVLVVMGVALIAYDVMTTIVMPRYLTESAAADQAAATFTPSGNLTDEAASAISQMQTISPSTNSSTPAPSIPTNGGQITTQTPQTNDSSSSNRGPAWRERVRARLDQ